MGHKYIVHLLYIYDSWLARFDNGSLVEKITASGSSLSVVLHHVFQRPQGICREPCRCLRPLRAVNLQFNARALDISKSTDLDLYRNFLKKKSRCVWVPANPCGNPSGYSQRLPASNYRRRAIWPRVWASHQTVAAPVIEKMTKQMKTTKKKYV